MMEMEKEDQNTIVSNSQELFVIVKWAINFVKNIYDITLKM